LQGLEPHLRLNRFHGSKTLLKRKENSPQGHPQRLQAHSRYRGHVPCPSWCRNVGLLPFRGKMPRLQARARHRLEALAFPSGPTNPCPTAVHMEPFPTQSSRISLEYLLLPPRSEPPPTTPRLAPRGYLVSGTSSYTNPIVCLVVGQSISSTLERHPFSGLVHSAGKLLHTSWRVPTSMATVLLSGWTNTFCGI